MKLNSHLVKSRHGVFYFRIQRNGLDKRFSLRTKDINVAITMAYRYIYTLKIMNIDMSNFRGFTLKTNGKDVELITEDNDADRKAGKEALFELVDRLHPKSDPLVSKTLIHKPQKTLSHALEEYKIYLQSKELARKTIQMSLTALVKMQGLLGEDFDMASVNDDIIEKEWMLKRKAEFTNRKVIENGKSVFKEISWPTIAKELSWIKSFFEWSKKKNYSSQEITLNIPRGKGLNESYDVFTKDELKLIFDNLPNRVKNTWHFWIPLIGLYTGARIGEIAALRVEHFKKLVQIHQMFLPGTKNEASPRWIPIHPDLIKIGLLDLVNAREAKKHLTLFDIKTSKSNGIGAAPSKWFASLLTCLNIKSQSKVFHSFRHTLIELCRQQSLNDNACNEYVGHSKSGNKVHGKYGSKNHLTRRTSVGMKNLKEQVVDHIDFQVFYEWSLDIEPYKNKADDLLKNESPLVY